MGYHTFTTPKKSGGTRTINAPDGALKKKQRELLKDLQNKLFWISKRAHGFARKRNILTNARAHLGKKWILNLDILNFFPSLTERIVGSIRLPYGLYIGLNGRVDRTLIFHNRSLPQGAPTSPFLSNYCMRGFETLSKFKSLDKLLAYAEGSSLNPRSRREGLVFKSFEYINGEIVSFKVVNNAYLLDQK